MVLHSQLDIKNITNNFNHVSLGRSTRKSTGHKNKSSNNKISGWIKIAFFFARFFRRIFHPHRHALRDNKIPQLYDFKIIANTQPTNSSTNENKITPASASVKAENNDKKIDNVSFSAKHIKLEDKKFEPLLEEFRQTIDQIISNTVDVLYDENEWVCKLTNYLQVINNKGPEAVKEFIDWSLEVCGDAASDLEKKLNNKIDSSTIRELLERLNLKSMTSPEIKEKIKLKIDELTNKARANHLETKLPEILKNTVVKPLAKKVGRLISTQLAEIVENLSVSHLVNNTLITLKNHTDAIIATQHEISGKGHQALNDEERREQILQAFAKENVSGSFCQVRNVIAAENDKRTIALQHIEELVATENADKILSLLFRSQNGTDGYTLFVQSLLEGAQIPTQIRKLLQQYLPENLKEHINLDKTENIIGKLMPILERIGGSILEARIKKETSKAFKKAIEKISNPNHFKALLTYEILPLINKALSSSIIKGALFTNNQEVVPEITKLLQEIITNSLDNTSTTWKSLEKLLYDRCRPNYNTSNTILYNTNNEKQIEEEIHQQTNKLIRDLANMFTDKPKNLTLESIATQIKKSQEGENYKTTELIKTAIKDNNDNIHEHIVSLFYRMLSVPKDQCSKIRGELEEAIKKLVEKAYNSSNKTSNHTKEEQEAELHQSIQFVINEVNDFLVLQKPPFTFESIKQSMKTYLHGAQWDMNLVIGKMINNMLLSSDELNANKAQQVFKWGFNQFSSIQSMVGKQINDSLHPYKRSYHKLLKKALSEAKKKLANTDEFKKTIASLLPMTPEEKQKYEKEEKIKLENLEINYNYCLKRLGVHAEDSLKYKINNQPNSGWFSALWNKVVSTTVNTIDIKAENIQNIAKTNIQAAFGDTILTTNLIINIFKNITRDLEMSAEKAENNGRLVNNVSSLA